MKDDKDKKIKELSDDAELEAALEKTTAAAIERFNKARVQFVKTAIRANQLEVALKWFSKHIKTKERE